MQLRKAFFIARTADARRRTIIEAVWRLATAGGLEDVTMRAVASEAELSLRLVQYYFGTRDALLASALAERRRHDRERLAAEVSLSTSHRDAVRVTLRSLLPVDDEGRTTYLLNVAYFIRVLRHPELAADLDAEDNLERIFQAMLTAADAGGELFSGLHLAIEAMRLVALQDGLSSRLLMGTRTREAAERLIDYHLDSLFPAQTEDAVPPAA